MIGPFASSWFIALDRRSKENALPSSSPAAITLRAWDRSLLLSRSCRYPPPSSLWPVACSTSSASSGLSEEDDEDDEEDEDDDDDDDDAAPLPLPSV